MHPARPSLGCLLPHNAGCGEKRKVVTPRKLTQAFASPMPSVFRPSIQTWQVYVNDASEGTKHPEIRLERSRCVTLLTTG
jgi:hypothetical protein